MALNKQTVDYQPLSQKVYVLATNYVLSRTLHFESDDACLVKSCKLKKKITKSKNAEK